MTAQRAAGPDGTPGRGRRCLHRAWQRMRARTRT
jgi:hypothetical protein